MTYIFQQKIKNEETLTYNIFVLEFPSQKPGFYTFPCQIVGLYFF